MEDDDRKRRCLYCPTLPRFFQCNILSLSCVADFMRQKQTFFISDWHTIASAYNIPYLSLDLQLVRTSGRSHVNGLTTGCARILLFVSRAMPAASTAKSSDTLACSSNRVFMCGEIILAATADIRQGTLVRALLLPSVGLCIAKFSVLSKLVSGEEHR